MADQQLRTRRESPDLPEVAGDADAFVAAVTGWDLARREVWLVEDADGALLGHCVLVDEWVDDLYVDPGAQGHGVGSILVDLVKSLRPDGFGLWVFERNRRAREFYAGHGLIALERTDGRDNPEDEPELRMVWPSRRPLEFLRARVDEVDVELGELLARRVALTQAIQPHKRSERRDPAREREIAGRVAARVPALDPASVASIMDAIITASLRTR